MEDLNDLEKPKPQPELKEKLITNNDAELDLLVADMPQVVQDAVDAGKAKEADAVKVQEVARDKKGNAFNPSIHAADPNGLPLYTPTGRFKIKTGVRAGITLPTTQEAPQADKRIRAAAEKHADIFLITGISIFGEEWKPTKESGIDERSMLVEVNEKWMLENGYVEPPAWMDLLLVYGLFIGKRLFQPQTKSRVKLLWDKLSMGVTNLWLKVTGQKIKVVSTEDKNK